GLLHGDVLGDCTDLELDVDCCRGRRGNDDGLLAETFERGRHDREGVLTVWNLGNKVVAGVCRLRAQCETCREIRSAHGGIRHCRAALVDDHAGDRSEVPLCPQVWHKTKQDEYSHEPTPCAMATRPRAPGRKKR